MLFEIACLVLVAALWGGTNPLLKKNTGGITRIHSGSRIKQFLLEIKYLATNLDYLVPMGLNQLGSVIYFITLQSVDVSLSVPVANSLTFVFTALSGWIVGEKIPEKKTVVGVLLILLGTTLCCLDKYYNSINKTSIS